MIQELRNGYLLQIQNDYRWVTLARIRYWLQRRRGQRCQDICKLNGVFVDWVRCSWLATVLIHRYVIIRSTNLPQSFQNTTTSPQLILISRAIENKLFERAETYQSYLDLSTLPFRLTALACAVLLFTAGYKEGQRLDTRSEACSHLLAAARNSLNHAVMVLVLFESQQLGFIQGT